MPITASAASSALAHAVAGVSRCAARRERRKRSSASIRANAHMRAAIPPCRRGPSWPTRPWLAQHATQAPASCVAMFGLGNTSLRPPLPGTKRAARDAQMKNPVMFVVEVGAALTTYTAIVKPSVFNWTIVVWLWLTVVFANLAEAVAEGRGKAQADTLRRTKQETVARRLVGWQPGQANIRVEDVPGVQLTLGDHVIVEAGEIIPGDGDVVEGVASVDESAITGESAPVIRESGGDRSAVTGGTKVLSDRIVVKITSKPGETFIDRMIALVEGAERQKT